MYSFSVCRRPVSRPFVAALYGSIKSRTTECALALNVLDDEREYLEKLSRRWASAKEIDRTSTTVHVRLSLLDKRNDPPRSFVLSIPDMSGETFREQFESRQWTVDFQETYAGAELVLLFVHTEKMDEPATLSDLQHARTGLDNAVSDGSSKVADREGEGMANQTLSHSSADCRSASVSCSSTATCQTPPACSYRLSVGSITRNTPSLASRLAWNDNGPLGSVH